MRINIKKTHHGAIVPAYQTAGAACFDLHAVGVRDEGEFIGGNMPATFRTGLAFEVPEGWVLLIFSRSGHGFKHDTRLANCVGVIDSDYRGEVQVKLTADGIGRLNVHNGDRIAQAMLLPLIRCSFDVVDELTSTDRGDAGFGSTGN